MALLHRLAMLLAFAWLMLGAATVAQAQSCTVVFGAGGAGTKTLPTLRVQPGVVKEIADLANTEPNSPSTACGAPASSYNTRPRFTRDSDGQILTTGGNFTFTYDNGATLQFTTGTSAGYTYTAVASSAGQTISSAGHGRVTALGNTTGTLQVGDTANFEFFAGGAVSQVNPPGGLIVLQIQVIPPPSVSGITPTGGPTAGGTSVTISGSNFSASGNAVTFDGTAVTITAQSTTSITVTAPAHAPGAAAVVVTTTDGLTATSPSNYTYVAAPTVTSLAPTAGPTTGGNSVVMDGTNFTGTTAVTFGGVAATSFVVRSNTQISAIAPAAAAGIVNVRVTTTGGTSATATANQYRYASAPTIASVSPQAGPPSGGNSVIISGTDFTGATLVTFGGATASFAVNSPTQITATAPAGSGSVPVAVRTPGGTATLANGYTYASPPIVTSVTPNSGATAGNTGVTIAGTGFTGTASVTFGGTAAASFTVNSDTQITAVTPAHAAGAVTVAVGSPGGTGSLVNGYTYVAVPAAPVVTAPANGSTIGTTTPTVTGVAPANATVTIYLDGSAAGTTTATAGGAFSFAVPTALSQGSHTVYATATTGGGTSANSNTNTFTVDTVSPVTPVITAPANGASITTTPRPVIAGTAEAGSTVQVTIDGTTAGTTAAGGGSFSFTPPADLAPGSHTVSAIATDAAGNMSPASPSTSFTITLPVANGQSVTAPFNTQVAIMLTASDATSYTVATPPAHGTLRGTAPNLTYTPDAGYSGPDSFTFTASNGVGTSSPATVSITVAPGAPTANSQSVTTAFNTVRAITLTGSDPNTPPRTLTYTVITNPSHGTLSGTAPNLTYTPIAGYGGPDSFQFTASNSGGTSAPATVSITVAAATVTVAPASLPSATVGAAYSQTITASGGSGPYTFVAGNLPAGLTLSPSGVLSGTPTQGGSVTVTVTATDSSTGTGPYSGTRQYTLTVAAPTVTVAPATLPGATRNVAYSQTITAAGGTAPYIYAVTGGALPSGLTLATNGTLSGTPTASGSFTFTITATDASTGTGPYSGSRSYTLAVAVPTIIVTPATLPNGAVDSPYSQTLTASGGTGPYGFAVTAGALPAGLTLATDGTLAGTPTDQGSFTFTVTATEQGQTPAASGSQSYTLVVAARLGGATRTWVSGVGDDANPCDRTAPCQTFAAAFARTAVGGEINCLDPGGYGALTITHAVTIMCGDKVGRGGVLVSGGDGITVAAPADAQVTLSGLDFEGVGNSAAAAGVNGIRFQSGGTLLVRNSTFRGFRGDAIDFEPTTAAQLYLTGVRITDSGSTTDAATAGVLVRPAGAVTARVTVAATQITGGRQAGIRLETASGAGAQIYATIERTTLTGNGGAAVLVRGLGGGVQASVVGSTLTGNGYGVITNGSSSVTTLGDSVVARNTTGVFTIGGGATNTAGGNILAGNTTDGAFTAATPTK